MSNSSEKKVAIVHYWLTSMRGGERVLEALCELYPSAVIFTNVLDENAISEKIKKHEIRTTFINKLPFSKKQYKKYLPLMPLALEQLDLSEFDLIISNESGPAKGVITRADALHICYCFSPMRYLWDFYPLYLKSSSKLVRFFMIPTFHYLRMWDVLSSNRADSIVAISETVKCRIFRWWNKESTVIHPPVDLLRLKGKNQASTDVKLPFQNFYLCLGALVEYKRVDIAVKACNTLGRNLLVIGNGSELQSLRNIAGPTIKIMTNASDDIVREALKNCTALIFPAEEDFGLVPLEAMAFNKPVLAFGRGGALDTVTPQTGLLFYEQSEESLIDCLLDFEELPKDHWKEEQFQAHLSNFSMEKFKQDFSHYILNQWNRKFSV